MIPLGSGDEMELTIDFFDFFVFIYYEHIHQINLGFLLLTLRFLYVKKILKKFGSFILRKIKISSPWYAHVRVRIRGSEMLVFRNICVLLVLN